LNTQRKQTHTKRDMTVIRVFQTIKQWTKWYRIRSVRQWKGKKNWQRKEIV